MARSACTYPCVSVCECVRVCNSRKNRESAMHMESNKTKIERNSEDDLIVVTDHVSVMYWFLCRSHSKENQTNARMRMPKLTAKLICIQFKWFDSLLRLFYFHLPHFCKQTDDL